jgi:hypothetical protein
MFLGFPTSGDKARNARIRQELLKVVLPRLQELGFSIYRPLAKSGNRMIQKVDNFPLNYFRVREGRLEKIVFMWRKYGTPLFTIDFYLADRNYPGGSITEEEMEASFPMESWRARAWRLVPFFDRWFGLRTFTSLIFPGFFIGRAVQNAHDRVLDIDHWFRTGKASGYLRCDNMVFIPPKEENGEAATLNLIRRWR